MLQALVFLLLFNEVPVTPYSFIDDSPREKHLLPAIDYVNYFTYDRRFIIFDNSRIYVAHYLDRGRSDNAAVPSREMADEAMA